MKRINYEVLLSPSQKVEYGSRFKETALLLASEEIDKGKNAVVRSIRTGQLTYILKRSRTSCRCCGNELEGKKHCPLCNTLHYYE